MSSTVRMPHAGWMCKSNKNGAETLMNLCRNVCVWRSRCWERTDWMLCVCLRECVCVGVWWMSPHPVPLHRWRHGQTTTNHFLHIAMHIHVPQYWCLLCVWCLAFAVKFLREVTPYFRKASIISEVGWELQRAFLCPLGPGVPTSPPAPTPKTTPRADTRYIPLQLTHLARNLKYIDPGKWEKAEIEEE